MTQGQMDHGQMDGEMARRNYLMLGYTSIGMLIVMYLVMFTMIYSLGEFVHNINFFYMAIMMAIPMIAMMPLIMPSMYPAKRLNLLIYAGSAVLFVLAFLGIRAQALVGDTQFLRSMIPHHSGAVLMCERAKISDREIQQLCDGIIRSQKQEIDQMKQILKRL
ncbi:MAG: DUF305 domain-containing protein [Sphingomicrobium sp.]